MYGRAEEVIGESLPHSEFGTSSPRWVRPVADFFRNKGLDARQRNGINRWNTRCRFCARNRIDLMQVHNLVDVQTHLATLREWKQQGRIRYLGITHHEAALFPTSRKSCAVRNSIFCRSTYSLMEREAEQDFAVGAGARDRGPHKSTVWSWDLFDKVRSKPLPDGHSVLIVDPGRNFF